jgi:GWxTD domain-containing protein
LHRLKLQELKSVKDPQPLAGNFSLAGLPPGEYTFEARLELGDTVIRRMHPFEMAAPVVAALPNAAPRTGYFWNLTEQELSTLFDPVVVWLESEQERELYSTLNTEGKREFLSRQFGREEPTPDDGKNSALDEYLHRIRTINANYAERAGREGVDAWRTDRGRIYLLRGEPGNRLTRPSPPDGSPYELWFYPIGAGYVYVYVDQTRLGDYRLLFSNDPAQPTPMPEWYKRLGATALEDIQRFGIRLPKEGGGGGG